MILKRGKHVQEVLFNAALFCLNSHNVFHKINETFSSWILLSSV